MKPLTGADLKRFLRHYRQRPPPRQSVQDKVPPSVFAYFVTNGKNASGFNVTVTAVSLATAVFPAPSLAVMVNW